MSRHDWGTLLLGFVFGWNCAIVMTLFVTSGWWDRRRERKAAKG